MVISAANSSPQRRWCVLIVDDNLDQVHTMAYLLKHMGHHVDYAINGIVALELAPRIRPEVVLLDMRLPDVSGLYVARQMRRKPELKGMYIVGMTAFDVNRAEALAAGFDELLIKPVGLRLLKALLEQL